MEEYICLRCNKSFKRNKTHLQNHFLRKNSCKVVNKDIKIDKLFNMLVSGKYLQYYEKMNVGYVCKYCNKSYSSNSNLLKHLKKCKLKDDILIEQTPINKKNNYIINNIQNQTINNITNNNTINININAMGNEDLSSIDFNKLDFITDKTEYDNLSLINKGNNHFHNIKMILNDIFTNPVNQNFQLINKKEQKYKVKVDDDEFESIHINELLNNINDIIINIYENFLDDNQEQLQHYIDHLNTQYQQLQKYKDDKNNKQAKEYYIIYNKIQKCLKRTIQWIAEDNKKNDIFLNT